MGKVKVGMIKIYLLNYQITDKNILKRNVSYYCSVPQELVNLYKNEKNLVINKKLFLKKSHGKAFRLSNNSGNKIPSYH